MKIKQLIKKVAIVLPAFVIGIIGTLNVYAYEISVSNGYGDFPYEYRFHTDFSSTEESTMSSDADAWNDVGVGPLVEESSYTNNMTTYPKKDGVNNVTELSTPSDYLAQCTYYTSWGSITEADINFNPSHPIDTSPNSAEYDMGSIFTHEVGHALGLGHSNDGNAVMYPTFDEQEVRTVNSDDSDGILDIYQ